MLKTAKYAWAYRVKMRRNNLGRTGFGAKRLTHRFQHCSNQYLHSPHVFAEVRLTSFLSSPHIIVQFAPTRNVSEFMTS
jgi:hypothetical protein